MSRNLIHFWLYQCDQRDAAYELLEKYQYHHRWTQYGDLGGIYANVTGKFFEPDENGKFYIAQAVWHDVPCMLNYVEEPLLYDIIAWHPDTPRQWYFYRNEPGLLLGEKAYFEASLFNEPLILHSTPLAWLRSGCSLTETARTFITAAANGDIPPDIAAQLVSAVASVARVEEMENVKERLESLERAIKERKK